MDLEASEATTGSHEHWGAQVHGEPVPLRDGACLDPPLELQSVWRTVSQSSSLPGSWFKHTRLSKPRGSAPEPPPSPSKQPSLKPKHFRVRSSDCTGAKLSWGQRPSPDRARSPGQCLHLFLNTLPLDLEGSHGTQQRPHQPLAGAGLY